MVKPEEFDPVAAVRLELEQAYEELAVAGKELRQQNQELLEARRALEAERQRFSELFDLAPDAYLVTDLHGLMRQANRAAAALLGTTQDSLPGCRLDDHVPEADRPALLWQLAQLGASPTGVPRCWEMRLKRRTGEMLEAALTVAAVTLLPVGQWIDFTLGQQVLAKRRMGRRTSDMAQGDGGAPNRLAPRSGAARTVGLGGERRGRHWVGWARLRHPQLPR